MRFSLSEDVINAVLTYLGQRPYIETADLIHALKNDAQKVEVLEKGIEVERANELD